MKTPPPKTFLKFLRWFCREGYLEEIEGDLTELAVIQITPKGCDDYRNGKQQIT